MKELIPHEVIEQKILLIRGHKVMLDRDLAILYGVSTKRLNEQVRRNLKRFPPDFMFQLNEEEFAFLRSLFATLKTGRGRHRKYLPYVFTEQGVAMLSSVLNSDRAVEVNILIMRTFVKLRLFLSTHQALAEKLSALERKVSQHTAEIQTIFEIIRQMMEPPTNVIGFKIE
jgi:hypothetical protein